MRRLVSCLAAAVAALAIASASEASPWRSASTLDSVDASLTMTVGFGCKIIDRKLVCGKDADDDDNDDDKNGGGGANKQKNKNQEKKKQGNICAGEVACPPGYVVLDKPNKYGACCEPKEGLPAPTTTEKCKFPGEVGTPPNCHCPAGTEFVGYKGCVKVTVKEQCIDYPPGPHTAEQRAKLDKAWEQVLATCPAEAESKGCLGSLTEGAHCCCKYKAYEK